ncbi:hypothetical protein AAG747_04015 [Rapidithrix thailandica]|uniref:Uncharacterized protein n=1 Tax=Rapidithrix thailandica TaxID=413964 RepID=A0AAW9S078_9BACT
MGKAWFNDYPAITSDFNDLVVINPEITNAYFAKKVVTREENGDLSVSFEQIHDSILGREVYILVEMENSHLHQDEPFRLSVLTGNEVLTGTNNEVLSLIRNGQAATEFEVCPGDTDALLPADGNNPYVNLEDFENTLICKVALRPNDRATFDTWAENMTANGAVGVLQIKVASDALMTYEEQINFEHIISPGDAPRIGFTVENKIVYEIYHPENAFNPLGTHTYRNEEVRRRIGKIGNDSSDRVTYIFRNAIDNEYDLCECDLSTARRRANGQTISTASFNRNYSNYTSSEAAPQGGDAETNYHYADGSIISHGTRYGYKRYALASPNDPDDLVELIRMPDNLNVNEGEGDNNVRATFTYRNTARRYCNPESFAGFLGVLIQLDREDVVCTGMCFADATSYPSVTHPNGDSVDTAYLATLAREQLKVDALNDHYFVNIFKGRGYKNVRRRVNGQMTSVRVTTISWLPSLTGATAIGGHEDHLHAGDFDSDRIFPIN